MGTMAESSKQRLIAGWLDHVFEGKIATRWAVLEQAADRESVTLRLFRSEKELCEKHAFKLCKENFIGTERGSVKQYNRRTPARYWAIITVRDQTLLFQDSHNSDKTTSIFEKWDKILKEFWNHQSWLVTPLEGPNSFVKERGLTLHINRASVCFAYLNPPRHYCRLYLDTIEVSFEGTKLRFTVSKENNGEGCYEVKTEREKFALRIKEVIELLRSRYLGISPSLHTATVNPGEIQKVSSECSTHHLENCMPLRSSPQQDRRPPISSNEDSLDSKTFLSCCNKNSSICVNSEEQHLSNTPSIQVISGEREPSCCQQQVPIIPPRTTSCIGSNPGQALKSDYRWPDNPAGSAKLQKGMSASTGKLHTLKTEPSWEPPIPVRRKKIPENPDSPCITSAVHLPLPPVPGSSGCTSTEKTHWTRHIAQDDYGSTGDSLSSINSDVVPMDETRSLSSLSSEEERCRSSSAESRGQCPIRNSALSLTASPLLPNDNLGKNPGYNRSFSVPTELPQNRHCTELDHFDPDYVSINQDYMNVSKDSLTSPKENSSEDSLYLNVPHEQSPYVNPPLIPSINPVPLPKRPADHPRPPPSPTPHRSKSADGSGGWPTKTCHSMELHEVLEAMRKGEEQGSAMGLPLTVWWKFCLNCDIEMNSYSPKNWRGLAEQLGLSNSDIVLVDDFSRRYCKKPTEVILTYWERQAQPRRPFNKTELISMLHELERQDLLDIIIQRGTMAK